MSALTRAYSLVTIKGFDPEKRTFSGIATSPQTDRTGDIIESKGVKFRNPLALLLYHNSTKPVGEARFGKPTAAGTPFDALISSIDRESGIVKERLDEAVDSLSAKPPLIRAVSIGFRSLEDPIYNRDTGGFTYPSIEVLELSMVVIPAHQDATIDIAKSIDAQHLAASGQQVAASPSKHLSGDSDAPRRAATPVRREKTVKKSYSDQIKDFEATRASYVAERDAIMDTAAEKGETLDADQRQSYDDLDTKIKSTDEHLVRLRAREEEMKKAAVPVSGANQAEAAASRGTERPVITVKDTMPADVAFGAMVLCKAHSYLELQKGNFITPMQVAQRRYPGNALIQGYFQQKTAVAGGTTTDANFAAALLAPATVLESAFLDYLRPMTLVDRFGTSQAGVQIPSLMKVPFNVKVQSQTSGASAGWVGQGKPKPVTKFNTTSATLLFTKIAAISVITEELARFSRPGAEPLVRNQLAKAVVAKMDTDFIDPSVAVSSGVNPASITNGLTALTSAGTSAANVLTDIQALVAPFLLNNYDVSQLVILMPNTLALTLSLMQNSLGQDSFKGMTTQGGSIAGIPVLSSQYLASGASYGNMVVCLSAENIALADDGNVSVDASREASIEMSDAPGQDATAGTGASLVSMFQTNSIAIRAEREINWLKLRSTAVTYMDDVNWGSIGSPF